MKKLTLVLSMLIALIGFNANAAIYLVGNEPLGQGWDPSKGVEMTDNNDGTYTFSTVINGTVWFCFADDLNSNWDVFNGTHRFGPTTGSNQIITAGAWTATQKQGNGSGSYQFEGTGGEYVVTFDLTNMRFKIEGYVAPIVFDVYSVAGTPASIFGEEWSDTNTLTEMTLVNGLYTWTKEGVELTNGTQIEFKIVGNHDWGHAWPSDNYIHPITESGTYDLTFTFDEANQQVGFTAVKIEDGPEVNPLTGMLYVLGQVNGNNWNPSTGIEMSTNDENVFTLTDAVLSDSGDGYAYFSFTSKLGENADDWSFNDYRRGAEVDGTVVEDGVAANLAAWGTSNAFKALAGTYDMTVNLSAGTVLLDAKQVPQPTTPDIYIMGNVNDLTWDAINGVLMNYDETNDIYTAEITVYDVENSGIGYFGFTKKLADPESETPWDDIAAYRFGPVCEPGSENWVMTEELLGVDCALATDGSYYTIAIPAATWIVTVDVTNHTFAINGQWPAEQGSIRGDVNMDESVSIADVTALIDYLLTQDTTGVDVNAADCNLDEDVTIGDVTTLIDYLLTNEWPAE